METNDNDHGPKESMLMCVEKKWVGEKWTHSKLFFLVENSILNIKTPGELNKEKNKNGATPKGGHRCGHICERREKRKPKFFRPKRQQK